MIDFRDAGAPPSFRTPLEDLAWLVLDSPEITFSASFLSRCSSEEVLVLGVNERHLPNWISLPWTRFHRQGEVLALQLGCGLPLRKRLWQEIVRRKITAQAACLMALGASRYHRVSMLVDSVRSGDPDNIEARAAIAYWPLLFGGMNFVRHAEDLPNALLDYGYAILRAAIARHLCAIGFVPQIGIHHASLSNAYNLADDLIEPFRPFVDLSAAQQLGADPAADALTVEHRRTMVRLLDTPVRVGGEVHSLFAATSLAVGSLKQALAEQDSSRLSFPEPPA